MPHQDDDELSDAQLRDANLLNQLRILETQVKALKEDNANLLVENDSANKELLLVKKKYNILQSTLEERINEALKKQKTDFALISSRRKALFDDLKKRYETSVQRVNVLLTKLKSNNIAAPSAVPSRAPSPPRTPAEIGSKTNSLSPRAGTTTTGPNSSKDNISLATSQALAMIDAELATFGDDKMKRVTFLYNRITELLEANTALTASQNSNVSPIEAETLRKQFSLYRDIMRRKIAIYMKVNAEVRDKELRDAVETSSLASLRVTDKGPLVTGNSVVLDIRNLNLDGLRNELPSNQSNQKQSHHTKPKSPESVTSDEHHEFDVDFDGADDQTPQRPTITLPKDSSSFPRSNSMSSLNRPPSPLPAIPKKAVSFNEDHLLGEVLWYRSRHGSFFSHVYNSGGQVRMTHNVAVPNSVSSSGLNGTHAPSALRHNPSSSMNMNHGGTISNTNNNNSSQITSSPTGPSTGPGSRRRSICAFPSDSDSLDSLSYSPTIDDLFCTLRAQFVDSSTGVSVSAEIGPVLPSPDLVSSLSDTLKKGEVTFDIVASSKDLPATGSVNLKASTQRRLGPSALVPRQLVIGSRRMKLQANKKTIIKQPFDGRITVEILNETDDRFLLYLDGPNFLGIHCAASSRHQRDEIVATIRLFSHLQHLNAIDTQNEKHREKSQQINFLLSSLPPNPRAGSTETTSLVVSSNPSLATPLVSSSRMLRDVNTMYMQPALRVLNKKKETEVVQDEYDDGAEISRIRTQMSADGDDPARLTFSESTSNAPSLTMTMALHAMNNRGSSSPYSTGNGNDFNSLGSNAPISASQRNSFSFTGRRNSASFNADPMANAIGTIGSIAMSITPLVASGNSANPSPRRSSLSSTKPTLPIPGELSSMDVSLSISPDMHTILESPTSSHKTQITQPNSVADQSESEGDKPPTPTPMPKNLLTPKKTPGGGVDSEQSESKEMEDHFDDFVTKDVDDMFPETDSASLRDSSVKKNTLATKPPGPPPSGPKPPSGKPEQGKKFSKAVGSLGDALADASIDSDSSDDDGDGDGDENKTEGENQIKPAIQVRFRSKEEADAEAPSEEALRAAAAAAFAPPTSPTNSGGRKVTSRSARMKSQQNTTK